MAIDPTAPTPFYVYEPGLDPPWLGGKWGHRWREVHGLLKQTVAEGVTQAVRARFITVAPNDGLKFIGQETALEQGPIEPIESYRARLGNRWATWGEADSDKGILDALTVFGFTSHLIRNNQWDWDGHPGNVTYFWARLWVILTNTTWTDEGLWGDPGVYADGGTWGSTVSAADCQRVRRLVKQWSGSHELIPAVIILLSGELWGDPIGGLWSDPGVWGGRAAYWDGW